MVFALHILTGMKGIKGIEQTLEFFLQISGKFISRPLVSLAQAAKHAKKTRVKFRPTFLTKAVEPLMS